MVLQDLHFYLLKLNNQINYSIQNNLFRKNILSILQQIIFGDFYDFRLYLKSF